jgi:hypothetical protein
MNFKTIFVLTGMICGAYWALTRERNNEQVFAFQFQNVRSQFLGNHKPLGELVWKTRFPEFRDILRRNLLLHDLNCDGCGNKARFGKTIQKDARSKEVIALPMR